jgi:fatty-acyl-CoA synthase
MRRHHWIAALALAFAVVGVGVVALGLFGFKGGWLNWGTSDFLVRKAPTPLALLAVTLGLVALVFALVAKPRGGLVPALLAIVVGIATYAVIATQSAADAKFPPVHDVSTAWDAPPMPGAALATERSKEDSLPVDKAPIVAQGTVSGLFTGRTVAEVNASTCKAAVPVTLTVSPAQAYAAAFAAVKAQNLRIVTADAATGSIDAVATNFWNMKEDVMARVRAEGAGARIDLRSISRHGDNDRGHNCRRITELRKALSPG